MKRGTPRHIKTQKLAKSLKIPVAQAIGHLELLWHFTAEYTPQGNVGKYENNWLESNLLWTGKPGELIKNLIKVGWIDTDPVHRLIIHDWSDHADESVRKRLQRAHLSFLPLTAKVTGYCPDTDGISSASLPDTGSLARARLPSPVPVPSPVPLPPTHSEKGSGQNGWHPDISRFLEEYPGQTKPDLDGRLYLSYVTSVELEATLFANLEKWKASEQWRNGYIPSSSKWLETGQWKVPPKNIKKANDHPDFLPNY